MLPVRNLIAAFTSFLGAAVWTKGLSRLVQAQRLRPHAARKFMHITTAPLFALTWPLYGPQPQAAYFAAVVPLFFSLRILYDPRGDHLVQAVTRERAQGADRQDVTASDGDKSALSRTLHLRHALGPISYGLSMAAMTATSWRNNPETYIALSALCFGDGMADVIGSACNGPRWPLPTNIFFKKKTIPGTMAFLLSSLSGSMALLKLASFSLFAGRTSWRKLILATSTSAVVELVPIEDNITVPIVAFLTARLA